MSVDRRPRDRFESDRRVADGSIRIQLDVVLANLHHLRKVDKRGRMEQAAHDFDAALKRGDELTPAQRNYVDGIYEKTMSGAMLPSVTRHIDKKRRGLKFG